MEAKLKEYRALRLRKEKLDSTEQETEKPKEKLKNFLIPNIFRNMNNKIKHEEEVLLLEEEEEVQIQEPIQRNPIMHEQEFIDPVSETSEIESFVVENQESWRYCIIKWSIYAFIWVTLYAYFLYLQFGAVFFVATVLVGICLNTRTRPKKRGEVSAYSVFNENCVSIDGTLKAEELQRQMIYGMGIPRIF